MKNHSTCRSWSDAERLAALNNYAISDETPIDPAFDRAFGDIARLAADALDAPMAVVILVTEKGYCLIAESGIGQRELPQAQTLCAQALSQSEGWEIPDALHDPRFARKGRAADTPDVRFYAGAPLRTADGIPLGMLCVFDADARMQGLSERQRFALQALSQQAMAQLELRRATIERERAMANQRHAESYMRQVVNSAADYAIISTDLEGKITSWNIGASNVLGWSEEEALGKPALMFFTREDIAAEQPAVEMHLAFERGRAADERWHVRKNGELFWAAGEVMPLKNESGQAAGFVKILRDRTKEKLAEQELKQLNDTLEMRIAERTRERDRIWRNSRDLLAVVGGNGVIHSVNPACTALLGYLPHELAGHHFQTFIHAEDAKATAAAIKHALRQPLSHFEIRVRHKNGQYLWFAWTAAGEEGLVYAVGRDITAEKKQAAQIMEANEATLRFALEAGGMGAWQWNIQNNESIWLQGMAELHGMPNGYVAASMDEYSRLIHPDDYPHVTATIAEALSERKDHRVEYRVVWPDRSVHWIEGRGKLAFDQAGEPVQMAGICIDITRRKRTEQDLRFLAQASAELSGLVDYQSTLDKLAYLAVPTFADWCAVDLLDPDGSLKRVAVAHVDPEKVQLAHELHRRFPPDPNAPTGTWNVVRTGKAELVGEITEALLEQSIQDAEYLAAIKRLGLRSYIGAPLAVHGKTLGVVTFIGAESGRIYGPEDLALAEDLARRAAIAIENANLYRALQEADHAKDVFLATLAHELRNPLAPIMNALGILKLMPGDKARIEQSVSLMERQVMQLARLIDDLMDISRITTGKIELKKAKTDLVTILNDAIETSRPHIEAGRHSLSVMLPDMDSGIVGDPVRLAQVFTNLLNNAAKYTNPGGKIEVALESQPQEFIVRIKDTGIGISPTMLKNVFTIFTQAQHPLERSQGGLGIGLSLVKGLVGLHGGSVEVFSAGLGQGSEFLVRLPKNLQNSASGPALDGSAENGEASFQTRRVLVVDDNVDAANTVAEILKLLGSEVRIAHDGLAAVDAAVDMQPDIMLLDIGLPGMNGYEVAQQIRSKEDLRQTLLVAVTGWGQDNDKQRAYQAGFDHHWVKPVGLEQLKKILSRD